MNSMGRGDINKFNISVEGPAKYKGIGKDGKPTQYINKYGKFGSRRVKILKNTLDKIDKFFHLKSKSLVKKKIKAREVQIKLTRDRADILQEKKITPSQTVQRLYELTNKSEDGGFKKNVLPALINEDVKIFLKNKINSATSTKDLEAAFDAFYENYESMSDPVRNTLEGQITNRLDKMFKSLDEHLKVSSRLINGPVNHYKTTKSKCELINSILKLAEKIRQPSKNDSNLVDKYKNSLRKKMTDVIKKDLKKIADRLKKDKATDDANSIKDMVKDDFEKDNCTFEDFFRIGSNKSTTTIPDSLRNIRDEITKQLIKFPK